MIDFPPPYSNPTSVSIHSDFLNNQVINQFLKDIENLPYKKAEIYSGEDNDDNHRVSRLKWVPPEDPFMDYYFNCRDLINHYNSFSWKFNLKSAFDNFQYTEYNSNTRGHYDWHIDTGPGNVSWRKISMVIQLSDPEEYEGGDLLIFNSEVSEEPFPYKSVPKQKGLAVIFPSFLPHKVTPVTKGIRKSLVWWVGGDHLK